MDDQTGTTTREGLMAVLGECALSGERP